MWEGQDDRLNATRERLKARRRARRLRSLTILIGIIVIAGFAVAQRGRDWHGGEVRTALTAESGEVLAVRGPVRARAGDFIGAPASAGDSPPHQPSVLLPATSVATVFDAPEGGRAAEGGERVAEAGEAETVTASAEEADADEAVGGPGDGEGVVPGRPQVWVHEVRRGETLTHIAAAYGVDVETIIAANDLVRPDRIQPGEQLQIPSVKGALHVVRRGESLWDISRAYRVSMDEIIETNQLPRPDRLQVGERLVIPGAQAIAYALRKDAVIGHNGNLIRNFDWPLRGRISSRFGPRWGRMHNGLDIAVPQGTAVRAAAGGVVRFSGTQGGYGKLVTIDHGNGVETRYAHNSRLVARAGQRVARGEIIAYSGNTGNSTGPHLHFEIRRWGKPYNPERYLR